MKAILLTEYHNNLSDLLKNLEVREIKTAPLKDDDVLVKIDGSPCNPSDIAFMRAMYGVSKRLPTVPGFEGSGIIVETGSSAEAKALLNKRVSCFAQNDEIGTWAEYFKTSWHNCIPVSDKIAPEQAACFFVNPFTAFGLFETAINYGYKCIIQNAAAGQVGRFIRVMAKEKGIRLINIVRRPQHEELLKAEGEEFVLNMRDKSFAENFDQLMLKGEPCIAFDAVGGEHSGFLINNMSAESRLLVYGGLSAKAIGEIDVLEIIFKGKKIEGFNLGSWIATKNKAEKDEISAYLQELILSKKCETKIQRIIGFDEIREGLYQYLTKMSDGKVILKPAHRTL